MLLTIHDANLQKVAFIDNEKQNTLHYFDDAWTRNLETGSSTFEFTVLKKATVKSYNYLNEKAFVSFKYNGKSYVFNVMTVEENEQTIKCYCENLNLELINEYANSYKATNAMSFVEYCNAMGLLSFTYLTIGLNEISDQKRTLEWDGQDTKLARLLSLAKKFDAEIDFDTRLNADSSIKSFKVNVYHKNDGTHQGVGRIRNDIQLTYGKNVKSITRKIDKTNVFNSIRPTGTKDGNTVVISGLSAWEEKNADGIVEFYQKGEMLYAPISMQMYPSTFTHSTINDQWTRKDITVDSDNPTVIRSAGIRELKKRAYPAITYDVDGFVDVEIGDTVKINDDGFNPILLIEARVADQKISFTNPDSNKTTFANFTALENRISDDMQTRLDELIEQAKPYTIKFSTDNGIVFKNNIGQSIVVPKLYKGGQPIANDVTWLWALDGNMTTGMTYTFLGSNVIDTATLTVSAYVGNDEVAVDEISFVNVLDGSDGAQGPAGPIGPQGIKGDQGPKGLIGPKGEQGIAGAIGPQGAPAYFFMAYADDQAGTGFSLTDTSKRYMGYYSNNNPTQSASASSYKWVDRSNVVATFMQSTAPANPPEGARWKYTGTSTITVNDSTIKAGEQYLFIGARWVKDVITSDNLQIKDQFINGAMIKNGAVTVDKLLVDTLSAVTSDLGSVTAGNLLLQRSFKAGSSVIPAYKYPDYKTGLFVDNHGLLVNGMPVQKTSSETMASDMPIVAMTAGEVRFSRVDITENLERLLHEGLSDPDFGSIQFGRDPDGRNALVIQVNGQVYLKGQNYTDWTVSTVNRNVRWKVQGNLVIVDYDVTFSSSGNQAIVIVPTTYVPKALMLTAKTWRVDNTKDRNAQLNADGGLHILGAEANQRYCGQIVWAY